MTILHIRQDAPRDGHYPIRLTLKRDGQPDLEAEAKIQFALSDQEQEDLRWYLEDYLERAEAVEDVAIGQIEALMKARGEELYTKVLAADGNTQALWFSIRNDLADLRIEIATGVAEAASIPWELMRDPQTDSPISLRVKSFVRVQSNPNISFVGVTPPDDGRVRLLYVACRPNGANDVELRAVANRLLQDLGEDRARFSIKALRPPTFEQLQKELTDAKEAGRPYHIVHFDGHGIYADLTKTKLDSWVSSLSSVTLGGPKRGKHGYLLFEHPGENKMRPVDGQALGQLLHDSGVPVLVLNACQSAMHEATAAAEDGHRHSTTKSAPSARSPRPSSTRASRPCSACDTACIVVTAAQYIGQLYAALAKGRAFGQAASEGRKHLARESRPVGRPQARPLQDWFVPVVYEAAPIELFRPEQPPRLELEQTGARPRPERTPPFARHVPEAGFMGRDETLLLLDRAFDESRVVLLHAYAGQGKTATAVEFARWYAQTGGLGQPAPSSCLTSFESHTDLDDVLNQIGQPFAPCPGGQRHRMDAMNDTGERRRLVLQLAPPFPRPLDMGQRRAGGRLSRRARSPPGRMPNKRPADFLQQIKLDRAHQSQNPAHLPAGRTGVARRHPVPRSPMPRMKNRDAAKLALSLGEEKKIARRGDRRLAAAARLLRGQPADPARPRRPGGESGHSRRGANQRLRGSHPQRRAGHRGRRRRSRAATNPLAPRSTTASATPSRTTNYQSSLCCTCFRAR